MRQLELTILRILFQAHPGMVKGRRLYSDVNIEHPHAVTTSDLRQALEALQHKDGGAQITGTSNEDDTTWGITPQGIRRIMV